MKKKESKKFDAVKMMRDIREKLSEIYSKNPEQQKEDLKRMQDKYHQNDYHINLFFSEKDNCYVADIPDLKYCSAFGDTPEEALKEILVAKKLWIDTAKKEGMKIPVPNYKVPFEKPKRKINIARKVNT